MKADRLLSALLLLQAHGRLSTREISERLEVSRRTAHRDMEALCLAGVPLIAHRGALGGWELEKGWRTRVPGLNEDELRGLLMAQPSALGDVKLTAAAQRAYDKLMASMPDAMRMQAQSILAQLYIDPTGWWHTVDDLSMLPLLQDAVARSAKVTFLYTRADGDSAVRTVEPLGMVCKQNIWYLVARAPAGVRTYKVARIRDLVTLAIPFQRPAGFNLADYWKRSVGTLIHQRHYLTVTVALSEEGSAMFRRWCRLARVPDFEANVHIPKDWTVFQVKLDNYEQARFILLGLGSRAIALSPQQLVEEIAAELSLAFKISRSNTQNPDTR